jgi:hypothetical protein
VRTLNQNLPVNTGYGAAVPVVVPAVQHDVGMLRCWGHLGVLGGSPPVPRNSLLLTDVPLRHHRQVLQDKDQDPRRYIRLW